jgi:hypothetical protein
MQYRDGLLIVLISVLPVRRRTGTAMRIGKQLVRAGELWALDIPPEDTKGKRALGLSCRRPRPLQEDDARNGRVHPPLPHHKRPPNMEIPRLRSARPQCSDRPMSRKLYTFLMCIAAG